MNPGMPRGEPFKVFQDIQVRLVFLRWEGGQALLDLMRLFSNAMRFAHNRSLEKGVEGWPRSALGPQRPTNRLLAGAGGR